jgi:hypothetical protein
MSAHDNKAIFLRFVEELGRGNIGIVDEVWFRQLSLLLAETVQTSRVALRVPECLSAVDRTRVLKAKSKTLSLKGDKIAVRWTFSSVYRGEPRPDTV